MNKKTLAGAFAAAVLGTTLAMGTTAFADVTLTYWGWDSNYAWPMMDAYEELHPDVHFEKTATEWGDMLTKTQQALSSGSELPTIIPMDNALIENWKKFGILENLYDYGIDDSKFVTSAVEKCTNDDGELIGMFTSVCPSGIAYKRDLAEEYLGTSDPEELQAMLSTYEDYYKVAADVAEKSNGEVYLFHSGQAVAEWFYFASSVETQAGDVLNATAKYTDVFEKLIALRDAGGCDTYQNGTAEGNATYAGQNHIFYPCPDWAITYYIESNDPEGSGNWGVIKAPVSYSHGGTALGICNQATDEQKQAAYDFIMWAIASEEGATYAKNLAGYISTCTDFTYNDDFIKRADEDFFGGEDISTLFYKEIASEMAVVPSSPWENEVVSVRNDVAQMVMDDSSMTVEDAVAAAIDELSQLVTDETIVIE